MGCEIQLTDGYVATIDDEDFGAVADKKWYALVKRDKSGKVLCVYAVRKVKRGMRWVNEYMHRLIMRPPNGHQVDHVDGDGLNNRRSNLRICTNTENQWNKRNNCGVSTFRGVSKHHRGSLWVAKIRANGRRYYLGCYANPEDAAKAYDSAALRLHGEFARTNVKEVHHVQ